MPRRPKHGRERRREARLPLFAVLLLFAVAAVYTSFLTIQQDTTVNRLASYDDAFDAEQGTVELLRLQAAVGEFAVGRPDASADSVELRFEVLQNRLDVLNRPSFLHFISGHVETDGIVEAFTRNVIATGALIPKLGQPGVANRIIDLLAPLDAGMTRLGAVASSLVSDQIEREQARLRRLHFISSAVNFGLIAIGVLLIILLLRDNRLMLRANERLTALANDLRRTSSALTAAHGAVASANESLAMQNATLRGRDEALRIQNARFDAALNNMSQGLLMADHDRRLIVCNKRFREMFGLRQEEVEPGAQLDELLHVTMERQAQPLMVISEIHQRLSDIWSATERGQFYAETDDASIQVVYVPMAEGGWVVTYEDISERRKVEANTEYLAHHDVLTGLPNRLAFTLRLNHLLGNRANRRRFALLFVDVDDFKDVNDTLGHLAGDMLLVTIAQRLRAAVREEDLVGRLGGDEFAIVQMLPHDRTETLALAQRLVDAADHPYDLEGRRISSSISIGIAVEDDKTTDAEDLFRNADMALYRAKAAGRNTWRFFEPEMQQEVQTRSTITADLRTALKEDQFEIFFQPIVHAGSGQLAQFEGLLRWHHHSLGSIAPGRFIPIAEESRLIVPIGEMVMRRACAEAMRWPSDVRLAVNLSPVQFAGRGLVGIVESALKDAGLDPSRLELEVTEGALLRDRDQVSGVLRELRSLGVTIALDDFGTGYASLSYLRQLPFDKIKIDRSFITGLNKKDDAAPIIEAVVSLAKNLNMTTTAEGVETAEQWRLLAAIGCTYVQGYLFDRPQSAASVQHKLACGDYILPGVSSSATQAALTSARPGL
jgi:diguanylate cyclase (GGDEF)-like protein/PAS domain S-box-containing protein